MVMFIKTTICMVFLIVINITDIKGYKIKNSTVVPTLALGLITGALTHSFLSSVFGMLIPLVLLPLFAAKMLGAGDIKAFCALGSVLGFYRSIEIIAFTFIAGGIIALIFILARRNFRERFSYLITYIKNCFACRKILSYEFGSHKNSYFRFSYAITAGFILTVINSSIGFI